MCVCFHHFNDAQLGKTYCTVIAGVYTMKSYSDCSLCCLFALFFFFFTVAVSPCSLDLNSSVTTGELDLVPALICHAKSENTVNWICGGWMKAAG